MTDILEVKYKLKREELLAKYEKRSKHRRKRVPRGQWITPRKLPPDYQRKRKVPKVDEEEEIESAIASIETINGPASREPGQFQQTQMQFGQQPSIQLTTPVLNDLDVDEIDDDVLFECLATGFDTDFENMDYILNTEEIDQIKADLQSTGDLLGLTSNSQLTKEGQTKDLDLNLSEMIDDFVAPGDNHGFTTFTAGQFIAEPPQESVLSSSSPFPTSMLSPSLSSTSPASQCLQSAFPEEPKLPDYLNSCPLTPVTTPTLTPSPPPPQNSSLSSTTIILSSSPEPSPSPSPSPSSPLISPPRPVTPTPMVIPRPSHGKNIFLLRRDSDSETSDSANSESESESSDD